MKVKNNYITGIAFTILSSICFGTMGLFNDFAERGNLTISQRIFYRFLIALIVVFIIIKMQKKSLRINFSAIKKISFGSIAYFSFTSVFLTLSYSMIGVGMSTILHFTYPIIVLLFAIVLDKERPAKLQIIGTFIAFIGLCVVIGPHMHSNALGILFALLSAVSFTLYVRMLDKPYCKSIDTLVLMFYVFLASTVFWAIPSIVSSHNSTLPVDFKLVAISLFGLAIIGTLVSSSFFNMGVKKIGGRMTSILSVFEPVTSVLIGVVILNEVLSTYFGVGMVLIISGVIMVTLFENTYKESVAKSDKIA